MRARMIWFAFFVVVIDAMGIGLLMPVLPDILEELTGGEYFPDGAGRNVR